MQRWAVREHRWTSASVCCVQNYRRTTPSTWLMTRIGPRSCLPNGLSQRPHKSDTQFKVSHNIYHINTSCCTCLQPSFAWFATSSTSNPGCQSAYHQRPGILCLAKKSMQFHVASSNWCEFLTSTIQREKSRQVHSLDFMAPASDDHISLICFLGAQGAKSQEDLKSKSPGLDSFVRTNKS